MKTKRSKLEKRNGIQTTLEGFRRFDYDYISFGTHWKIPDGKYNYRQNAVDRFFTACIRGALSVFGPLLIKVAYGARVTGRENLKTLKGKGALCVCNHFAYLDTLFVRQAIGHFRSHHTMTYHNNKTGIGGWFIRHAGMLSFSNQLAATRNLNNEMGRLLAEGKIINFYAEQAMWVNYRKPRPMKEGVFHYAVKYGVPVLPIFCTFEKNKRGHMKKLRIHILPPVYGNDGSAKNARIAEMKSNCEAEWRACYEKAYGVPLEYLPDRRKNKNIPPHLDL